MRGLLRGIPLLALTATPLARAADAQACGAADTATVAQWAKLAGKAVVASACKAMPNAPGTTIAVMAFDAGDETKDQVVALVEGGKVVAANRATIEEDATTEVGSFRVDTAPYRLSPTVRAFGTVFHSDARGASCPDAGASEELTLWVREGDALRPVLGTNLAGWTTVEGSDCMGSDHSTTDAATITIAVEKTSSHGFADLSLNAAVVASVRRDQLVSHPDDPRTARLVLHYDGKSYGSDMFRDFWYPDSVRPK
ncbi:hypothetical protein [Luteibacter yeojuensis]|uniref:Multidrug ABC transporter ATPase n=1 Tax=Luteibacter yeojuensis TaxID=345309 RepID=A0A0F3K5H7_9GAMM|nr:hypothetical protein [Luteibacter yeojuensis]KJV25339.1 multidrug ABC transporter ATPase [Luteibacter yeojuensis]